MQQGKVIQISQNYITGEFSTTPGITEDITEAQSQRKKQNKTIVSGPVILPVVLSITSLLCIRDVTVENTQTLPVTCSDWEGENVWTGAKMELIHPRPLRRYDLMTFHYKTTVFSVTEITELDHKDFPNEHKYISTKTEKVIQEVSAVYHILHLRRLKKKSDSQHIFRCD